MSHLTPAGFFFLHALQGGKTTYKESGKSVFMHKKPGTTVLVFKTDSDEFRNHFRIGTGEPASDVIFLYLDPQASPPRHVIFFVELKGSDHEKGLKQLARVIGAVREMLIPPLGAGFVSDGSLRALIVSDRASPRTIKKAADEFFAETNIIPEISSRKEGADLGKYLDTRL